MKRSIEEINDIIEYLKSQTEYPQICAVYDKYYGDLIYIIDKYYDEIFKGFSLNSKVASIIVEDHPALQIIRNNFSNNHLVIGITDYDLFRVVYHKNGLSYRDCYYKVLSTTIEKIVQKKGKTISEEKIILNDFLHDTLSIVNNGEEKSYKISDKFLFEDELSSKFQYMEFLRDEIILEDKMNKVKKIGSIVNY